MEGESSKSMTREAFGTFMQRFASASGLSFKDLSNFLLVMPRYSFDVDLNDPGGDGSWLLFCCHHIAFFATGMPALQLSIAGEELCLTWLLCIAAEVQGRHCCNGTASYPGAVAAD